MINPEPYVFEYVIKENEQIMNIENNAEYYKEVKKVLDSYQAKRNMKYEVADTIF